MHHMEDYGLSYGTVEEFEYRFQLFAEVDARLDAINSDPNNTFIVGHNEFSTWTDDEKKRLMGREDSGSDDDEPREPEDIEEVNGFHWKTKDWRKEGAVNAVQKQGGCGGCWAFASVGAMEGEHFIKTKKLLKLSEQQVIDCDD